MAEFFKSDLFSSGYAKITQSYADHIKHGRFAMGIDLVDTNNNGIGLGTSYVLCFKDGTVIYAGDGDGYGNCVFIQHGEIVTVYGHLKSIAASVLVGLPIKRGEVIGVIGTSGNSTGVHLHFSVRDYVKLNLPVKGFWDAGGINDTSLFRFCDPTPYVYAVSTTNPYKVLSSVDAKQYGAFTSLENAKKMADNILGFVYDANSGKVVYNSSEEEQIPNRYKVIKNGKQIGSFTNLGYAVNYANREQALVYDPIKEVYIK